MSFADWIRRIESDPDYRGQIVHVERILPRNSRFAQTERHINASVVSSLRSLGIDRLYSHQAEAIDAIRDGRNVVLVTRTASGKTLAYNIPTVESVLENSKSRALYLFPTKALAQDQLGKLNDLGFFPQVRFATYDGDTPRQDRAFIKRGAHIVLSNPDMLHVGILPYHTSWAAFFRNLRFVVIDEMHTYRGVFGAHVSEVMRRLRRICALYGAKPQFIACSATVANPAELLQNLTGLEATVVDDDGSPSGGRTFVFWNPPLLGPSGERRSSLVEATALFTGLVSERIRNITFAKARKSAELILKYSREVFEKQGSTLGGRIMSYRAGYTPEERRGIEQGLFRGDLIGVTATNALELGVDVGGLDATVLTGYPGTIASAWQQAGRSGRTGEEALTVMIALDGPLDQFLMTHPEYFFGRINERAIVNPNNRRILASHLVCAAYESPLAEDDLPAFGPEASGVMEKLEQENRLVRRGDRWYYRGDGYPAGEVNIRSASSDMFEIRLPDDRVLGVIEGARAYQTVHPGAIYLHQGETYLVRRLDLDIRAATVTPVEVNYYTEPREMTVVDVKSEFKNGAVHSTPISFGEVVVTSQVLGYRSKQHYSDFVLDIVDLDLPEQVFETEAYWISIPPPIVAALAEAGFDLCGSIHAAEHAAISMMPLFSTCDRWDLGGLSTPRHPDTGVPTIFVYDGYPGGVGIAESTYERLEELLKLTREMIQACPCESGCPSCIQSPKCGNNNEPLDKAGAEFMLGRILETGATAPDNTKVVSAVP